MSWKYITELDSFEVYQKLKDELQEDKEALAEVAFSLLPALQNGVTGAAGSAASNVVTYPLNLVVTRLQVQTKDSDAEKRYDGLVDAVKKIYANEGGISGFYTGVEHDTFKSAADSFLFFLAYNVAWTVRKRYPQTKSPWLQAVDGLSIGVIAGAFTKAVTMPIQNIVTRKQTEAADKKSSVKDIIDEIRGDKGLAGFWSGYSASLVLTLNPAVTFFLDSFLRKTLKLGDNPSPLMTFLLAANGKGTASLLMYPFKMAKSRAQVQKSEAKKADGGQQESPPENVIAAVPYIARKEGIATLYAGVWGEVLKGFFTHGLTMLVKDRIQYVAVQLYYLLASILRRRSKLTS